MGYDPKSTREDPRWFGVNVGFVEKFPATLSLADIKATPALKNMKLLTLSRLSVTPVTASEWKAIVALAGRKVPAKR
jgi:predicted RNA-binding protein with PUA-like domain